MTEQEAGVAMPKTSLVEEGTMFRGALVSKCPVIVRGSIDGEVTAPSLTISESGSVRGIVRVTDLRSEGELAGEIEADVAVLSGSVKDATVLRARSLEVRLSAGEGKQQVAFGECRLEVGDLPTKELEAEPAALAATSASTSPPVTDRASTRPPGASRTRRPSFHPTDDGSVDAALDKLVAPSYDDIGANGITPNVRS
jgi:cytoskeletal protein CcmA (bactofilin family)